jgi:hypothetical protein
MYKVVEGPPISSVASLELKIIINCRSSIVEKMITHCRRRRFFGIKLYPEATVVPVGSPTLLSVCN